MSIKDGDRLPHRRISIYFNINESICQGWQVLFCARSDPGIFGSSAIIRIIHPSHTLVLLLKVLCCISHT